MNSLHQKRWDYAKRHAENIVKAAKLLNVTIMFDGQVISVDQIQITDNRISVKEGHTTTVIFEADPEFDHGLYDTVEQTLSMLCRRFKLVKVLDFSDFEELEHV